MIIEMLLEGLVILGVGGWCVYAFFVLNRDMSKNNQRLIASRKPPRPKYYVVYTRMVGELLEDEEVRVPCPGLAYAEMVMDLVDECEKPPGGIRIEEIKEVNHAC